MKWLTPRGSVPHSLDLAELFVTGVWIYNKHIVIQMLIFEVIIYTLLLGYTCGWDPDKILTVLSVPPIACVLSCATSAGYHICYGNHWGATISSPPELVPVTDSGAQIQKWGLAYQTMWHSPCVHWPSQSIQLKHTGSAQLTSALFQCPGWSINLG